MYVAYVVNVVYNEANRASEGSLKGKIYCAQVQGHNGKEELVTTSTGYVQFPPLGRNDRLKVHLFPPLGHPGKDHPEQRWVLSWTRFQK